jgi:hypothetical protein
MIIVPEISPPENGKVGCGPRGGWLGLVRESAFYAQYPGIISPGGKIYFANWIN